MADNNGSSEMSEAMCEEMLGRYGERYRFVETGVHGVGNSRAVRRAKPKLKSVRKRRPRK